MRPRSRLRAVLARNRRQPGRPRDGGHAPRLERLTVTSRRPPVLRALYRYGGFLLFTPWAVCACSPSWWRCGRAAPSRSGTTCGEVTHGLATPPVAAILLVKLVFWLTRGRHQIIHALACIHYRRRVREFGFTILHGFIPTFYADVTDIFMASRRARIVNAVAGPLFHLFLGALCFWIASRLRARASSGLPRRLRASCSSSPSSSASTRSASSRWTATTSWWSWWACPRSTTTRSASCASRSGGASATATWLTRQETSASPISCSRSPPSPASCC